MYVADIGGAVFSEHRLGFRDKSWSIMNTDFEVPRKLSKNTSKCRENVLYWQVGSKYGMVCGI